MRKQVILAALLTITMLPLPTVHAESATLPEQSAVSDNDAEQPAGDSNESPLDQNKQIGTATSGDQRSINTAIESFTPTEEISADNAVPFPVDI